MLHKNEVKISYNVIAVLYILQIIVLEDTTEYISYAPKEEIEAQDRRPFDLLVCYLYGNV